MSTTTARRVSVEPLGRLKGAVIRGLDAANLKVAQQYVDAFGLLASKTNTMIIPANAGDVAGFVATAMSVLERTRQGQAAAKG